MQHLKGEKHKPKFEFRTLVIILKPTLLHPKVSPCYVQTWEAARNIAAVRNRARTLTRVPLGGNETAAAVEGSERDTFKGEYEAIMTSSITSSSSSVRSGQKDPRPRLSVV